MALMPANRLFQPYSAGFHLPAEHETPDYGRYDEQLLRGVAATKGFIVSPRLAAIALTPRRKGTRILVILLLLSLAPISIFAAAGNYALSQLAGYRVVPVHYGPLNKMMMSFRINGQSANLLVDTGASQLILDAAAAESFGIKPSQRNLVEESAEKIHPGRYIRFTQINGQDLPVGIAQSFTAGSMNFGSSPVALRSAKGSGAGNARVDGILGLLG
jgi:hypothetical protein